MTYIICFAIPEATSRDASPPFCLGAFSKNSFPGSLPFFALYSEWATRGNCEKEAILGEGVVSPNFTIHAQMLSVWVLPFPLSIH
jgi:hypothetical protein